MNWIRHNWVLATSIAYLLGLAAICAYYSYIA